ncbi:MAG: aminotransferase class V-fold PLP-dependent enzyme [Phycisphaerae bacterium]
MTTTRRRFLTSAAATAALGYAVLREDALARVQAAVRDAGGASADELAGNEDFWFQVQRAYDVDRSISNLNNGGVAPAPRSVMDAMRRHLAFTNHAPSRHLWQVLDPQVETVRAEIARVFGCDAEEIALTRNASESLEICLYGLDLKPGDEVLSTSHDYPRMLNTLKQRELREGIVLKTFPIPTPPDHPNELVTLFENNITPRTKVILVCHITNLTGQIFPIRRIVHLARRHGIQVIVDGAHAFAHFPFRHSDLDCDYYGTSLHKWLSAPIGTGFLFVRKSKIAGLWPMMAAPDPTVDDIRKFEEIGTHPAAPRLAIAEALAFYGGIGAERKAARLRYLRERWTRRLAAHEGVTVYTSLDPAQSCGIGTVGISGVDSAALSGYLFRRHRIVVTAIRHEQVDGIRVTPNTYTTLGEIDRFRAAMESVIEHGMREPA